MQEIKTAMGAIKEWIETYEAGDIDEQDVILQVGIELGRAIEALTHELEARKLEKWEART